MSFPGDSHNPYASPFGPQIPPPPRPGSGGFPVFAKTMFIIDLVLCVLRVPMLLLSFIGYAALQRENNPLLITVAVEVLTALGMVVFGVPASIAALLRKPWAVWLGWLAVAATLGSLGVGVWQGTIKMAEFAPGTPQRIGGYVGLGIALVFRFGLVCLYAGALVQFSRWVKRLPPAVPDSFR